MKCEVQLFVAGQVFTETVHAVDYQEQDKSHLLEILTQE